ncbi:hypothetical protein GB937_010342 [Aspergillus fischeri]|nr:hypothetical protein GB937_010342 [Aspergillus fischeri]
MAEVNTGIHTTRIIRIPGKILATPGRHPAPDDVGMIAGVGKAEANKSYCNLERKSERRNTNTDWSLRASEFIRGSDAETPECSPRQMALEV